MLPRDRSSPNPSTSWSVFAGASDQPYGLSKELGDTTCVRDPFGGPGWILYFPDGHWCEVMVCDDPYLHLEIIGCWVDWVNWDMDVLPPLVIPLDENGKRNHAFELQLLVSYTYGRLLDMSKRSGGVL